MKLTVNCVLSLAVLATCLAGCPKGTQPESGLFGGGPAELVVSAEDRQELAAAEAVERARANYEFRLSALRAHVIASGDMQKQTWSERELKNLADAQIITWRGLGSVTLPAKSSLAGANEVMLVELVVAARNDYRRAVDALLSVYQARQDIPRAELIERMAMKLDPIRTYAYYLSAEIPPVNLRATAPIAAADKLFDESLESYRRATGVLRGLGASADARRRSALAGFRGLVGAYPNSTKIGRSAFCIAQLYRHYGEFAHAAVWYDRAWQWDPQIREPVRYRAATLYEYKIGDTNKALEYYRLVVRFERGNRENVRQAQRKIKEIQQWLGK